MADDVIGEGVCNSYSNCGVDDEVCCDRQHSDEFVGRTMWRIGGDDSPMDDESAGELASSTSLQSMLSAIIEERNRDHQLSSCHDISEDADEEFVIFSRNTFWTGLFIKHFLEVADDTLRDDMLFYVRKCRAKSKSKTQQPDVEVYRRSSPSQPTLDDYDIEWEETVYLNLILQHFEYYVTCAVCSRTGEKELQILKKFTQRVYASPSRRKMDRKGTEEEITYPNIFFTIDNFEEAFADQIVRDSEMVCVELIAKDRRGKFQGVIFVGSINYDALKRVYDTRASLSHRMAQRMSLGWFRDHKRVEFVTMRGPQGKGRAEMAVSRVKGSGPETPCQTPTTESFPIDDFEENEYSNRRMSDPSSSWNYFQHGSLKRTGVRKSRSELENVDAVSSAGCNEVEASNFEDEFHSNSDRYSSLFGLRSFGQAWHWFKESRRANCVALHSFLTFIMLPWHRIVADLLDTRQEPVLSFEVV